jgi:hypothetical protein
MLAMGGAWVAFRRRRHGTKGAGMKNVLKKMAGRLGAAVLALVMAAGVCQASVYINLSLAVDTDAKTWAVYATLDDAANETLGLHGIAVDVWGSPSEYGPWTGVLDVNSYSLLLPAGYHSAVGVIGFGANEGGAPADTGYVLIGYMQPSTHKEKVSGGKTYNNILKGVGESAGSAVGGVEWDYPVLVADGTYTGDVGWLNVSVRTGAAPSVSVLPATLPAPTAEGVQFTAFSPEPGVNYRASFYIIPEPATLALLGLGGLGLILGRKRR